MDDDTMLNNHGPQPGAETVYGTEDNNMVMSEKVRKRKSIYFNYAIKCVFSVQAFMFDDSLQFLCGFYPIILPFLHHLSFVDTVHFLTCLSSSSNKCSIVKALGMSVRALLKDETPSNRFTILLMV
ncbi:unnamed protein product [Ceratitis capitata]|uniref:(Mediterranean fruit fly) hypothetical protein n=1 Tax=Ceratitis capitata TaxID=7213 RepID=A0A811UTH3_CERCA|nr:unnamed protein product [Ceratitis capitata]